MSTSNNETPVPEGRVCWHYPKAECAHEGDYKCWYCVDFDLDAVCFHYLSGECANNDECAHLHPAELDPALIPLLATPPYQSFPPFGPRLQIPELGPCLVTIWDIIMNEVTYQHQGGQVTLPAPHAFSYSLRPPASGNADGQSSYNCAYNLKNCWAPHCPDPNSELDQPRSAEQPHSAWTDADIDMVSQSAKTRLFSESGRRRTC